MKKIILIAAVVMGGMVLAPNAYALAISPPIFEIGANPGDNPTQSIKIFSETDGPLELYTSAANFTAKDNEEGTPEFTTGQDDEASMASWIEIESGPINLMPDEQKIVPYTIHIPQNADPGGHYAAVFFSTQPPQMGGSSIGLSGRLGTLVLLTVSGDIKEGGKIVEFATKDNKSFYEHLPISFSLLFANSGNVHLKPQGEIKITNLFGGLSEKIPFNREEMDGSKNVLPNTSRHLEAVWSRGPLQTEGNGFIDKLNYEISNFALGRYKATIDVGYGTQGKTAAAVATFWVFPWHLILVVSLAAVVLISLLVAAIKNYNNWIVRQAMRKRR